MGNLSEGGSSLALRVDSRFSQQHKCDVRALYFLLNAALVRISWWDMPLFLLLLDFIILTELLLLFFKPDTQTLWTSHKS